MVKNVRLRLQFQRLFAGKPLQRAVASFCLALRVYRERRALAALSEQQLKDIGLSRSTAYREASRSVFDLPADRCKGRENN